MRKTLILSGLVTALSLAASAGSALAQRAGAPLSATNENYCLEYKDGTLNCTYATLTSCYMDRSSEGGSCIENPNLTAHHP